MAFERNRLFDIRIYFRDSPSTLDITGVCHMGTEGGLYRVITDDGDCQWWPLDAIFNIRRLAVYETTPVKKTTKKARH
jgi:hypothetical protein